MQLDPAARSAPKSLDVLCCLPLQSVQLHAESSKMQIPKGC